MQGSNLDDAAVVITGASSGIGRATALELAQADATLVIAARDETALNEVAEACRLLGARCLPVPTDVTDSRTVLRLAESALRFGNGRIRAWINNAGVGAVGPFDETPLEAHEQVVQTDLLGYMRGAHAVLPYFKQQKAGVLVNVLSVGSWVPQPYAVAYSAAKHGLKGYTEALRGELARWPDIHVCDVYPHFIDTPGLRDGANYYGRAIKPMPPVYDARLVARAIADLLERPRTSTTVGSAAQLARVAHAVTPGYSRLAARLVERALEHAPNTAKSAGNLFHPPDAQRRIDGGWRAPKSRRNLALAGAAAALTFGVLLSTRTRGAAPPRPSTPRR